MTKIPTTLSPAEQLDLQETARELAEQYIANLLDVPMSELLTGMCLKIGILTPSPAVANLIIGEAEHYAERLFEQRYG